jgi:hypothetical protein
MRIALLAEIDQLLDMANQVNEASAVAPNPSMSRNSPSPQPSRRRPTHSHLGSWVSSLSSTPSSSCNCC